MLLMLPRSFWFTRRSVLKTTAAVLATPWLLALRTPPAAAIGAKSADLKQRLEAGLQARRPEEFSFIKRVVDLVDQGKLSTELVQGTFDWARDKRPYPYPFFERAIKLRAARIGVVVR
jgi:hypothetical protein